MENLLKHTPKLLRVFVFFDENTTGPGGLLVKEQPPCPFSISEVHKMDLSKKCAGAILIDSRGIRHAAKIIQHDSLTVEFSAVSSTVHQSLKQLQGHGHFASSDNAESKIAGIEYMMGDWPLPSIFSRSTGLPASAFARSFPNEAYQGGKNE